MVVIDYTCITSFTKYNTYESCYLNDLKFLIMVAYTIFQVYVTYVNLIIALKCELMSLTSPVYTNQKF